MSLRDAGQGDDAPAAKHRVTVEDLLLLRQLGPVDAAPDGSFAVVVVTENDLERSEVRVQVHRVELEGEPRERQITYGLAEAEEPRISPDGKQVAFLTFRPQPGEDDEDDRNEDGEEKRQVFVLPAEGGEARRLTKAAEGVAAFVWWPDGDGVAYLTEAARPAPEATWRRRKADRHDDPVVVHGDLRPMEIWRQPMEGKATRLFAGDPGLSSFDVAPDGKRLAYVTNHTGVPSDDVKSEAIVLDLATGGRRPLTGGRAGGEDQARWSPDGRRVAVVAPCDPAMPFSRHDILVADPDGLAPLAAATAAFDRTVETYAWSPDGTILALVARGMDAILVRAAADGSAVREVVADRRYVTSLAVARGSGRIAFVSEDHVSPPEAWACEPDGASSRRLTRLNEATRDWLRAPREVVTWENEGFVHEGLLVRPLDPPPGGAAPPLLVIVHGGPHAQVTDRLQSQAEAWAADGWAVFLPQYRGSRGQGDAYARASFRDLGGADFRDILAGVDRVVALGAADPERMAVTGSSYGGYMTNWALARSDRFKAGVSQFGIYSLFGDFDASEYPSWDKAYLGSYYWDDPSLYAERSVSSHVRNITAPLLLLHGIEDDTTLVTNSKALYRALREMGRTVEMVVYPREGHGFREPSHRLDAFRRARAWLEKHVLGREAPPAREGVEVAHAASPSARLRLTTAETLAEIGGRRPPAGSCWLVVEGYLRGGEGIDALSLEPSGPRGQVHLLDGAGRPWRPVGVPLDVLEQRALLEGGAGRIEVARGKDGSDPSLPFAAVFEIPAEPAAFRLLVRGYPPIRFEVAAPRED